MCPRLIQHRGEEMHPRMGIRVGHPKQLSLNFLDRVLFQLGQDEKQPVGRRGQRTRGIRRIATAGAVPHRPLMT
jgi:hypothetical protein